MKGILLTVVGFCFQSMIWAQTATQALEGKSQTPQERYGIMKANSQTFQDYKVIKEYILDGVWKIGMDSLKKRETEIANLHAKINALQEEISLVKKEIKSKEDSMSDITFASTHISVFGIDFSKRFFTIAVAALLVMLTAAIVFLVSRVKMMQVFVNESKVITTSLTNEFDEFKRKALEKQSKLSRELQTERNKLIEMRGSQHSS